MVIHLRSGLLESLNSLWRKWRWKQGCWSGGRPLLSFIENRISYWEGDRFWMGSEFKTLTALFLSHACSTYMCVTVCHCAGSVSLFLLSVCLSLTPPTPSTLSFFQGVSCFLSLNGPVAYEQLPVRLKLSLAVMRSPADTQSHSAVFSSTRSVSERLLSRTVILYAWNCLLIIEDEGTELMLIQNAFITTVLWQIWFKQRESGWAERETSKL